MSSQRGAPAFCRKLALGLGCLAAVLVGRGGGAPARATEDVGDCPLYVRGRAELLPVAIDIDGRPRKVLGQDSPEMSLELPPGEHTLCARHGSLVYERRFRLAHGEGTYLILLPAREDWRPERPAPSGGGGVGVGAAAAALLAALFIAVLRHWPLRTDKQRLRVLFAAANPGDTRRLRIDREYRDLKKAARAAQGGRRIAFRCELAVTPEDLSLALRYRPHALHLSCHGTLGSLRLEGQYDGSTVTSQEAIVSLLHAGSENLRLAVFSACFSRPLAEAAVAVIDCAVGMSDRITDDAAIAFSTAFWGAVGDGESVQTAFNVGLAILRARHSTESSIPIIFERHGVSASDLVLLPRTGGRRRRGL